MGSLEECSFLKILSRYAIFFDPESSTIVCHPKESPVTPQRVTCHPSKSHLSPLKESPVTSQKKLFVIVEIHRAFSTDGHKAFDHFNGCRDFWFEGQKFLFAPFAQNKINLFSTWEVVAYAEA